MVWNKEADTFIYRFDALLEIATELPLTKRGLLKLLARVYNPLGLISPILVMLKVAFQETYATEIEWDERLSDHHVRQIKTWLLISNSQDTA